VGHRFLTSSQGVHVSQVFQSFFVAPEFDEGRVHGDLPVHYVARVEIKEPFVATKRNNRGLQKVTVMFRRKSKMTESLSQVRPRAEIIDVQPQSGQDRGFSDQFDVMW
jgi:hypothetical protein